jgi:multimeric flavodoxin WrbA
MNVVIVREANSKDVLVADLEEHIRGLVEETGRRIDVIEIARGEIAPCVGCLTCLKTDSRRCVANDGFEPLRQRVMNHDLAVFLSPALFGQWSSTFKNAIDKGIAAKPGPGMRLPPVQVFIGFGSDLSEEEAATFVDCVRKHQGRADVIHRELKELLIEAYIARSIEDCATVAANIEALMLENKDDEI